MVRIHLIVIKLLLFERRVVPAVAKTPRESEESIGPAISVVRKEVREACEAKE